MSLETGITSLTNRVGKAINDLLPDTWYQRSDLPLAQQTSIKIYKTSVMINGKVYKNTSATTLSLNTSSSWDRSTYATAANRAGEDIYIYACVPASGTVPVFKLSANSTVPTGYSASTSRKIGGFHCLCLAVGTISGHTLSGYATGDILPLSVWDLKFHAVSGSEGMIYKNGLWTDIYLAGWDGTKLVSNYCAQIADGTFGTNPANGSGFSGESLEEYASYIGKSLISRQQFKAIAEGSNQRTVISTKADPVTSGGHKDTAGRRMISNCGCEDCCGAMYQWTSDLFDSSVIGYDTTGGSNTQIYSHDSWYTTNKILNEHNSCDPPREESVWETTRTSYGVQAPGYTSTGRGCGSGILLRRLVVGGSYTKSRAAYIGSRAVLGISLSSNTASTYSTRLVSLPYYS